MIVMVFGTAVAPFLPSSFCVFSRSRPPHREQRATSEKVAENSVTPVLHLKNAGKPAIFFPARRCCRLDHYDPLANYPAFGANLLTKCASEFSCNHTTVRFG
jgi:hypothetical protein